MTVRIAVSLLAIGSGLLAATAHAQTIYKCATGGVTTYADRPCGSESQLHELNMDAMNTYQAPAVSAAAPARVAAPKRVVRSQPDRSLAKKQEMCARTGRSLKEIANKMRSGYSAKEGERLRERQAKLRDQQREARCR